MRYTFVLIVSQVTFFAVTSCSVWQRSIQTWTFAIVATLHLKFLVVWTFWSYNFLHIYISEDTEIHNKMGINLNHKCELTWAFFCFDALVLIVSCKPLFAYAFSFCAKRVVVIHHRYPHDVYKSILQNRKRLASFFRILIVFVVEYKLFILVTS